MRGSEVSKRSIEEKQAVKQASFSQKLEETAGNTPFGTPRTLLPTTLGRPFRAVILVLEHDRVGSVHQVHVRACTPRVHLPGHIGSIHPWDTFLGI